MAIPVEEIQTIKSLVDVLYTKRESQDVALISCTDMSYSYSDYYNSSVMFSKSIGQSDLNHSVAVHAFNCPEWAIATMGAIMSRRMITGIYSTNSSQQCQYVIDLADVDVLVLSSYSLFKEKYQFLLDPKYHYIKLVFIEPLSENETADMATIHLNCTMFWDRCRGYSNELDLNIYSRNDPIALVFTSGTTGMPKAVILTNQNFLGTYKIAKYVADFDREISVSYLPLSHVAPFACDIVLPLLYHGAVGFAKSDALKGSLKESMTHFRPSAFLGVPRVYQKFREAYQQNEQRMGWAMATLVKACRQIELFYRTNCFGSIAYPLHLLCDKVLVKIRERMGCDRGKFFTTGASKLDQETFDFFTSIGLPLCQAYGMSETAAIMTCCQGDYSSSECNGYTHPDNELKISNEGEIYFRGDTVFQGYYKNLEETMSSFDGPYFKTGDLGRLENGRLYITGRKKELMKTSGGENIPYLLIEQSIQDLLPKASRVVLIGNNRKFLSCLIVPKVTLQESKDSIQESDVKMAITKYNASAFSNTQKVQKFTILDNDFSIETGELTPTLKLKRAFVNEKYSQVIDQMYVNE